MPSSAALEVEDCCERIKTEYREMPGLCLTKAQVQRRWNLDAAESNAVLERLTATRFLRKTKVGYALSREASRDAMKGRSKDRR